MGHMGVAVEIYVDYYYHSVAVTDLTNFCIDSAIGYPLQFCKLAKLSDLKNLLLFIPLFYTML